MSGFPLALVVEDGRFKPANAVTLSRGLLIAPIFALLWAGHSTLALGLYGVAAATDVADGWLARRFQQASAFGAQLDAVVDNLFSVAILGFLALAYPGLVARQWLASAVLFGAPLVYLAISWLLTRRVLMFHVWSAKVGAALLFCLWPAIAVTGWQGWLWLSAGLVGLSRLEQVILIARGGRDLNAAHGFARLP
ncbi:CDP-alcohol phosphatidyltransferase family protein [Phenylobacterium sp.]|uniref:CDP-alcohol phosphatidyltransferase family protein n=1 Tax=Phenylobacterium sp. TaxID=1871053 RepID=UPI00286CAF19|nr:CDP-alcohol phosphatidyltransferase family protein [Phenylobacterium sp.]